MVQQRIHQVQFKLDLVLGQQLRLVFMVQEVLEVVVRYLHGELVQTVK